jgi:hypothetical protein
LWWKKKHRKRKASRMNVFALLQMMGLKTVSTWG